MRVDRVGILLIALGGCDDEQIERRCAEGPEPTSQVSELSGRCFPYELDVDADPESPSYGHARCTMYASFPSGSADCACTGKGLAPAPNAPSAVREKLQQRGHCDDDPCCPGLCLCELVQLDGADLQACQNDPADSQPLNGWCYVSPEQGIGSEDVVANCGDDEKRLLRIFPFRLKLTGVLTCVSSVTPVESDGG